MRHPIFLLPLLITAACTAPETIYCEHHGTPEGSAEYAKCTSYYFSQQAAFNNDRVSCDAQADLVYPPSLYSQGTWAMGYDPWGRPEMVPIQPDWQQNHALDEMRMTRIIEPCMQAKGWNSGRDWTAGHHAGSPAANRPAPAAGATLPWKHK